MARMTSPRARSARRGPVLAVLAALALVLVRQVALSFVPPRRVGPLHGAEHPSRVPVAPLDAAPAIPATAAVAAAGLLPLVALPEASVAQGWEQFVVTPLGFINTGLNLYKTALGIYAIMSWLFAFGIIDYRNEIVQKVQGLLSSIIDPVLQPLRAVIPPLAGFDISFMVLWFVLEQAQAAAVAIIFGALTYDTYNNYY
mmetsp:Transcript_116036/g.361516  ORF Transcript_116036/g.361516 Transcript_116036/m.361516 type:complete len:199 (-) Transcript_116036:188-784(-)